MRGILCAKPTILISYPRALNPSNPAFTNQPPFHFAHHENNEKLCFLLQEYFQKLNLNLLQIVKKLLMKRHIFINLYNTAGCLTRWHSHELHDEDVLLSRVSYYCKIGLLPAGLCPASLLRGSGNALDSDKILLSVFQTFSSHPVL